MIINKLTHSIKNDNLFLNLKAHTEVIPHRLGHSSRAAQRKLRSANSLFEFQTLKNISLTNFPPTSPHLPIYPVVILGGGISGLTAATYLAQAGYSPLIIEGPNPGGAIMQSDHIRNWPGIEEIGGAELIGNMHRQAEANGAQFQISRVIDIDYSEQPYILTVEDLFGNTQKIRAQSVVVAMGTSPKFLGVTGEEKYWTNGVYNCALCDGPLYRDKSVGVVGGSNSAITEALYLSKIAKKVTIFMRGNELGSLDEAMKNELLSRPNVEIRALTTIESIEGDEESMKYVVVQSPDGLEKIEIDALFLAIGSKPNTAFFKDQLDLDEYGYLITNDKKATSAKGIFAIGDITQIICKQAVCAAGDAAEASIYVSNFLNEHKQKV